MSKIWHLAPQISILAKFWPPGLSFGCACQCFTSIPAYVVDDGIGGGFHVCVIDRCEFSWRWFGAGNTSSVNAVCRIVECMIQMCEWSHTFPANAKVQARAVTRATQRKWPHTNQSVTCNFWFGPCGLHHGTYSTRFAIGTAAQDTRKLTDIDKVPKLTRGSNLVQGQHFTIWFQIIIL